MGERKIKGLVFIADQALNARDYKRFGIELLKNNGFNVRYWDITSIIHPGILEIYVPSDSVDFNGLTIFNRKKTFYEKLAELGDDVLIFNLIGYTADINFIKFFRHLRKVRPEYATMVAAAVPEVKDICKKRPIAKSILEKVNSVRSTSLKKITEKILLSRIPVRWLGLKSPKMLLVGGEKSMKYNWPIDGRTEVVKSHALDYDLYLEVKDREIEEERIAVFVDIYMPFHPDWLYVGKKHGIDPDKYYGYLDKVFAKVEKDLGLEVVIAAHPRSEYDKKPDYFRGRRYIKGETIELIRKSKLVLTHHSTAVNFANLFYKPILFMMTNEADKYGFGTVIRAMAALHGKAPVFIEDITDISWAKELSVDGKAYRDYRRSYIKSDNSPELPFWQIAADHIKSM